MRSVPNGRFGIGVFLKKKKKRKSRRAKLGARYLGPLPLLQLWHTRVPQTRPQQLSADTVRFRSITVHVNNIDDVSFFDHESQQSYDDVVVIVSEAVSG